MLTSDPSGKVFINYRRSDDPGSTGRLKDFLERQFKDGQLFFDVEGMKPGDEFADVLKRQVQASDVLLAVIGPQWLTLTDGQGRRRLDDPEDWVRLEIAEALKSRKLLIPVLVGGANIPRTEDLPHDIQALSGRHVARVSHETFAADATRLAEWVRDALHEIAASRTKAIEAERRAAAIVEQQKATEEVAREAARVRLERERALDNFVNSLTPEEILKAEEIANWEYVKGRGHPDEIRDHVRRFPDGFTRHLARATLATVEWARLSHGTSADQLKAFLSEFAGEQQAKLAEAELEKLNARALSLQIGTSGSNGERPWDRLIDAYRGTLLVCFAIFATWCAAAVCLILNWHVLFVALASLYVVGFLVHLVTVMTRSDKPRTIIAAVSNPSQAGFIIGCVAMSVAWVAGAAWIAIGADSVQFASTPLDLLDRVLLFAWCFFPSLFGIFFSWRFRKLGSFVGGALAWAVVVASVGLAFLVWSGPPLDGRWRPGSWVIFLTALASLGSAVAPLMFLGRSALAGLSLTWSELLRNLAYWMLFAPVFSLITFLAFAVAIATPIRILGVQPFNIVGGSMQPTLIEGHYFLVRKYAYGYSRYSFPFAPGWFNGRVFTGLPLRGELVVFRQPRDNQTDAVSRIIGLPSDEIQMIKGVIHINGKAIERQQMGEHILANGERVIMFRERLPNQTNQMVVDANPNGDSANTAIFRVPPGHYFVISDNRDNAVDSRSTLGVGFVPFENFVGPISLRFFERAKP